MRIAYPELVEGSLEPNFVFTKFMRIAYPELVEGSLEPNFVFTKFVRKACLERSRKTYLERRKGIFKKLFFIKIRITTYKIEDLNK